MHTLSYLYSGAETQRDRAQTGERRAGGETGGSQSEERVDSEQATDGNSGSLFRGEDRSGENGD